MKTMDRLRLDHLLLCSHLDVLQSAVSMTPQMWLTLRSEYITVSRRLETHSRRERQLVASYLKVCGDKPGVSVIEHDDPLRSLRTLNPFFIEGRPFGSLQGVYHALKQTVEDLHEQLHAQEMKFFPALEQALASGRLAETQGFIPRSLRGTMTVENVLREYPTTRPVFERFFISLPFEAYECLDEIAHRRGMELDFLLAQLQEAIIQDEQDAKPLMRRRQQRQGEVNSNKGEQGWNS